MRKRRAEITIETDQVFVIRSPGNSIQAWCAECASETNMVAPEVAAVLSHVSARTVYRWAEAGQIHFMERPEGSLLVCLKSLLQ